MAAVRLSYQSETSEIWSCSAQKRGEHRLQLNVTDRQHGLPLPFADSGCGSKFKDIRQQSDKMQH